MQTPYRDWVLIMLKIKLRIYKLLCTALCVVLLGSFAVGCTGSFNTVSNEENIIFIDALNRKVFVPKNPKRTAALIGSFAEVWQLSGGEVCATAEDAWDDFELELKNCVNLGGAHSPSLESLLSSNPDFVIASASTASNVKMRQALEDAGITVAYFDVDSFDDYLVMLDICTDITGRKDLYEKNGVNIKKQIDTIKKDIAKGDIPKEKRTVLMLRTSSGSVKAKGSEGTVLGEMLDDLGCINIADSDSSLIDSLSVEAVIRQNPYRIFVVAMGNEKKAMQSLDKMMVDNPAWGSLDAVKEGRLYVMDRKLFNIKPNEDWAKSYEKLSEILLGK